MSFLIAGCAPKAGFRQSAMMRQTQMEVSADELRVRVYNLANGVHGWGHMAGVRSHCARQALGGGKHDVEAS